MRTFTESDLKKAAKVGKRYCSFQFIEGQGPRNQMLADEAFAVDYCLSLIANTMAKSKFTKSPEEIVEGMKRTILSYYKNLKGSEEPQKEGAE
ncbi:MAG: hypothetical protein MJZ11_08460 [Lachnospiraceae bacterium]|nr:hypothetical protein [Lachnospiraceae bacterium]